MTDPTDPKNSPRTWDAKRAQEALNTQGPRHLVPWKEALFRALQAKEEAEARLAQIRECYEQMGVDLEEPLSSLIEGHEVRVFHVKLD